MYECILEEESLDNHQPYIYICQPPELTNREISEGTVWERRSISRIPCYKK